jgi:hypothetical protein
MWCRTAAASGLHEAGSAQDGSEAKLARRCRTDPGTERFPLQLRCRTRVRAGASILRDASCAGSGSGYHRTKENADLRADTLRNLTEVDVAPQREQQLASERHDGNRRTRPVSAPTRSRNRRASALSGWCLTNWNYLGAVKVKIAGIPVPAAKKA